MPFADDLTVYIDSSSTSITAGTNLFKNAVVETTRRSIFVIETRGQASVEKFSGALPAITRPSADVIVRSTTPSGGSGIAASTGTRSLAQDMWELLVGVANTQMNSKNYQRVEPQTEPYFLGHDDRGRAMFGFTVDAMKSASTN